MKKPAWSSSARTGPVRNFMELKIFACEGLICIIDEREGKEDDYTVVAPSELHERLRALNKKYRNKTPAEMTPWQRQEHYQRVSGSENCMECIKEARAMGDPTDPKVQAFWARHRRNATISFAPKTDPAGYPAFPPLPLGPTTGKQVNPDKLPIIHPPPKKKKNQSGLILLN